jgi:hypothetical protein
MLKRVAIYLFDVLVRVLLLRFAEKPEIRQSIVQLLASQTLRK